MKGLLNTVKPLTVNMELLEHQITITNALIDKCNEPAAKEYTKGVLELLICLQEQLDQEGFAIVRRGSEDDDKG